MAEVGDFQDLLDAIKTAKSILEPSRLDEIALSYKLERENQLDVENLKIVSGEITELEKEKAALEDAFGELAKEEFKGYLQPSGSLSNYTSGKISTLDDALSRRYQQKSGLQSRVSRLRSLGAQREAGSQALTQYAADYASSAAGDMEDVFEQADYDVAKSQYAKELKIEGFSDEVVKMRMHFVNNAYMAFHLSKNQEQIADFFTKKTGPNGEITEQFKSIKIWANPNTQQVGSQGYATQGVAIPALVDEAISGEYGFINHVKTNMQRNYDAGYWNTDNAPILVDADGEVSFNEEWMEFKNTYTGETRRQEWTRIMIEAAKNFTAHTNPNQAFIWAMDKNSPSRFLLKSESEKITLPGYSFGKILWGSAWESMEDFYQKKAVQKYLNINVRSTMSHKDRIINRMKKPQ